MRIICEINDENIRKSASILMKHFNDQDFLTKIREEDFFNHTLHSPVTVASVLERFPKDITLIIKPYKTFNPFSNVIGYAEGNIIFINTRKLGLNWLDRVENLYHEMTHICGYSHKGNRVTGYNLQTVPYLVANIFKRHVSEIYER
jgi:hypothetical protein